MRLTIAYEGGGRVNNNNVISVIQKVHLDFSRRGLSGGKFTVRYDNANLSGLPLTNLRADFISADRALDQMDVHRALGGASIEQSETLPRVRFDFEPALEASAYSLHFTTRQTEKGCVRSRAANGRRT